MEELINNSQHIKLKQGNVTIEIGFNNSQFQILSIAIPKKDFSGIIYTSNPSGYYVYTNNINEVKDLMELLQVVKERYFNGFR